eukprot:550820-Hanusia_phi.AAC.1
MIKANVTNGEFQAIGHTSSATSNIDIVTFNISGLTLSGQTSNALNCSVSISQFVIPFDFLVVRSPAVPVPVDSSQLG